MKIEIMKSWGKIFLDLNVDTGFTSILVLGENGIEKCFIGTSSLLLLNGYYIADED